MNKVILIGRLGQDPVMRTTTGGHRVANFSLATNEVWKENGQKREHTEWHKIVAWRDHAKVCENLFFKGSLVCIEGQLQTRKWNDRDGKERQATEIIAHKVTLLAAVRDKSEAEETGQKSLAYDGDDTQKEPPYEDGDIPF